MRKIGVSFSSLSLVPNPQALPSSLIDELADLLTWEPRKFLALVRSIKVEDTTQNSTVKCQQTCIRSCSRLADSEVYSRVGAHLGNAVEVWVRGGGHRDIAPVGRRVGLGHGGQEARLAADDSDWYSSVQTRASAEDCRFYTPIWHDETASHTYHVALR